MPQFTPVGYVKIMLAGPLQRASNAKTLSVIFGITPLVFQCPQACTIELIVIPLGSAFDVKISTVTHLHTIHTMFQLKIVLVL